MVMAAVSEWNGWSAVELNVQYCLKSLWAVCHTERRNPSGPILLVVMSLSPFLLLLSTSSSEDEEEEEQKSKDTSLNKKRSRRDKKKDRKEKMRILESKMSHIQWKLQKLALERETESQQDVDMSDKVT